MRSLSPLQGILPTQGLNPGPHTEGRLPAESRGKPKSIPSPADLTDTGIEMGSPAMQAESLPTELSRKTQYEGK